MNAQEAIRTALKGTQNLVNMYLGDLSDADLLVRPVPGANHIAWQLGHFTATETKLADLSPAFAYPALPKGFAQQHGPETAKQDAAKGFATKEQYLSLFNAVRNATIAALDKLSDKDLDKPTTGPMAQWAPTLGALLLLTSNHSLMHAGQFTAVRRKLGKPVLF
jgi:hypothetical protein